MGLLRASTPAADWLAAGAASPSSETWTTRLAAGVPRRGPAFTSAWFERVAALDGGEGAEQRPAQQGQVAYGVEHLVVRD